MAKMGRPTKFKEEYCDALIEHMEKGYSFESFAGKLRVSKQTLYTWVESNPDFLDAKSIGTELARLYWEGLAIDHMDGRISKRDRTYIEETVKERNGPVTINIDAGYFNNTLWIFNMKNRFKQEWRDKQELEHSGPDGKPLQQTPVTIIIPDNKRDGKK